ncbi:hypothetical protein LguiB_010808 [Lonicera macranthoides]
MTVCILKTTILSDPKPSSPYHSPKPIFLNRKTLLLILVLLIVLGVIFPWIHIPKGGFFYGFPDIVMGDYTSGEAPKNVGKNGTVIVCCANTSTPIMMTKLNHQIHRVKPLNHSPDLPPPRKKMEDLHV